MANFYLLLVFFCSSMHLGFVTSQATRADNVREKFTLAGGPKSHLFSQCAADAMTVEGSLYSIAVSEDEDYVRFVPKETREVAWMDVELDEDEGIIQCSMKAFELSALMFKYDGGCSVALDDAYDPSRDCGDATGEVVYITTKPMSFFNGHPVPTPGDTYGCLRQTDEGYVYGVEDGRVVDEDTLPPRDTCCASAADGFCLVAECIKGPMTYCEAEARCLARGLRAASRSFHENVNAVDPTKLGTDEYYFWVNVHRQDDVWKWQDDGSDLSDFFWCGPSNTTTTVPTTTVPSKTAPAPAPPRNCAAIHFTDKPPKIEYYRTQCTGTEVSCILCYDPNDSLPAC